jgi:hypothetical protein
MCHWQLLVRSGFDHFPDSDNIPRFIWRQP